MAGGGAGKLSDNEEGGNTVGKKRWSRLHFLEVRDDASGLPNWGDGPLDNLPQLKRIRCLSSQEKVDKSLA